MIDIENDIYSYVASAIATDHPGTFVSGEYVEAPARFPAVTIVEADNRIFERMRTTNIENAVSVMYVINVFSNKSVGKKEEAKSIATTIDVALEGIGFTRKFREQIPNLKDSTIYRIVCRYEATIDNNLMIYQSE